MSRYWDSFHGDDKAPRENEGRSSQRQNPRASKEKQDQLIKPWESIPNDQLPIESIPPEPLFEGQDLDPDFDGTLAGVGSKLRNSDAFVDAEGMGSNKQQVS